MAAGFHFPVAVLAEQSPTDFWTSTGQGVISALALIVSAVGVVLIVWGAYHAVVRLIAAEMVAGREPMSKRDPPLGRFLFGAYLLAGLEFLIAGGVIRTLARPDWQHAVTLAALVLVRTLLGLSLKSEANSGVGFTEGAATRVERLTAPPKYPEGVGGATEEAVLVSHPTEP
jgi:uncharacterized membrane protein